MQGLFSVELIISKISDLNMELCSEILIVKSGHCFLNANISLIEKSAEIFGLFLSRVSLLKQISLIAIKRHVAVVHGSVISESSNSNGH